MSSKVNLRFLFSYVEASIVDGAFEFAFWSPDLLLWMEVRRSLALLV